MTFAHKSIFNDISSTNYIILDIKSTYIKNGFYVTLGNKGAVAISFCLLGQSILFINCHLAAMISLKK